jgi:hypothetical protein
MSKEIIFATVENTQLSQEKCSVLLLNLLTWIHDGFEKTGVKVLDYSE